MPTPKWSLNEINTNDANKPALLNENLRELDYLAACEVAGIVDSGPRGDEVCGRLYVVGASATGDWTGEGSNLAYLDPLDGVTWKFIDTGSANGFLAFNVDDGRALMLRDSIGWQDNFSAGTMWEENQSLTAFPAGAQRNAIQAVQDKIEALRSAFHTIGIAPSMKKLNGGATFTPKLLPAMRYVRGGNLYAPKLTRIDAATANAQFVTGGQLLPPNVSVG